MINNSSSTMSATSFADMARLAPKIKRQTVWCHPDNADLLRARCDQVTLAEGTLGSAFLAAEFFGMEVCTSKAMPKFKQKWEFPPAPFVDYEASDEKWAVPLKFGRWVDTTEPYFAIVTEPERPKYQPFNMLLPYRMPTASVLWAY